KFFYSIGKKAIHIENYLYNDEQQYLKKGNLGLSSRFGRRRVVFSLRRKDDEKISRTPSYQDVLPE
ncbi:MAG: hypothetical protein DRN95_03525, partial [Candidatus Hydrothermarchaeota archaeon]